MSKTLYEWCVETRNQVLLAQWDAERNVGLNPMGVSYGSHKKIWWSCENGHHWQAAVYARTSGAGCPFCKHRRPWTGTNDLASQNPELAPQWHPTKNGDLTPDMIAANCHKSVWWVCEKGHEWRAQIKSRTNGCGCPVCKNRALLVGENDLVTTHPLLAEQWHPEKNGSLRPENLVAGSRKKVWWICDKGHEWQAIVYARAKNGSDCPVCASKTILPGINDLASTFPMIAAQWHSTKNGKLTPESVSPYSNRKTWWVCERGHEYTTQVSARTMKGVGCPYCAGRKVLVGFNDLETLEAELAAQWHPSLNGTLTPRMVTPGSHQKVWWQCPNSHVWKAVVYSRARGRKSGCPVCAGKVKESRQFRYANLAVERLQNKK